MNIACFSKLLCLLAIVKSSFGVIVRDYNFVNHKEFTNFKDFSDTYLNGKFKTVNTNLFVGIAKPECQDKLTAPAFRGAQRNGGGGVVGSVSLPPSVFPIALEGDNCAQIFFFRIGSNINKYTATTSDFDHAALNGWTSNLMRVDSAKFTNKFPYPVEIFWHEESIDPISNGILEPNQVTSISTFLGHAFSASKVIENNDGHQEVVDFMVVNGLDYEWHPVNRLETCEVVPGTEAVFAAEGQALTCDDMRVRLIEYTHQVWHEKRLGLNYVQPQIVRAVTANGFEHRKLPVETYTWLKAWYDREKLLAEVVEGGAGPCMNQHVAPTDVTHLTSEHKDRLSRELRSTLEEWYGGELFLTSIYGIRKYNNGSVLRMHVDTVATHVVSAIINVDQDVEEDWKLLILDHNDVEHEVVMRPGDMVLYESAKLLHGRPQTFKGAHYDNIFIHYQPKSGWDYSWL